MRRAPQLLDRRRFVAGAAALPAACGLAPSIHAAFAFGSDRVRVGIVGCGGRGTGAALDAVAVDAGVSITCMADAFADQIESSAALLAARAGAAFACPPERRFTGPEAWRHVVDSDADLVILATPPVYRPLHAAAAVRAGKHVWCEKPGAVDAAGADVLATACATAAARGLSFASGLALRHDAATVELVSRVADGSSGRPLAVTVSADLGLAWHRPSRADWTAAECALRNWIAHPGLSGGHFVEHHVTAIDKALWVMGDVDPAATVPGGGPGTVRYLFDDGRCIDAALRRRIGASGRIEERVSCERGTLDLRRPATAPHGDGHPLRMAMGALLAAIRSGRRLDHGPWLHRATRAAITGRMTLETGTAVAWGGTRFETLPAARPLQSAHS